MRQVWKSWRRTLLLSCAVLAIGAEAALAQQAKQPLPELVVETKGAKKKKSATSSQKQQPAAPSPATAPESVAAPSTVGIPAPDAEGDIGYNATRTSSGTKTDTPLRNVPQSISVITDQQIKDQNFDSIMDITRYVPGIQSGQGENNRDTIIIRGQQSTADFYVNGVRDDAQIFRDFYNTARVEVLKGPNALIFGRGGVGGLINRVTKQADFTTVYEGTVSVGSFDYKRAVVDAGQAINPFAAFRITAMVEDSGSYRDFVELERWGVNPTFAFKPFDNTKVTIGYEHFEDRRTADRGIPSFNLKPFTTGRGTFFGNPELSYADAAVDSAFATIEHKTDFGLQIRNHTLWANYDKFYQNVYPAGAVRLDNTVDIGAYNNENDRQNLFNQTDLTYKLDFGLMRHTLMAGAEFGHQESDNHRHNGLFANNDGTCATSGANAIPIGGNGTTCRVSIFSPTIFTPPVTFDVTANKSHVEANVRSFYIQDQMEITRYLEIIGGVRHDTFDLGVDNLVAGTHFDQKDSLVSPRAAVILKPTEYFSIYGSYAVSHLPASGDQFGTADSVTVTLDPEKYINYEIGAKWDITPALSFTAAAYHLDRENVRVAGVAPGSLIQTGKSEVEGIEIGLTGYVTDQWQISAGYANQRGELTSATSATLVPGTKLANLPEHTFSLWNRYDFNRMWGAGVGVVYRADTIAALLPAAEQLILPDYVTVDAALFFRLNEHLKAQLNVENLFNEKYFINANGNNNLQPGAPTAVYLSVTSNF